MRIVNPIYDVAFKYLMEDIDIARQLIGKIIGESIQSLHLRPQEIASKSEKHGILIFGLDFKATILTEQGHYKNILIELQKAKMYDDLFRFRKYLGENYRKQDEITLPSGITEKRTLPITTIYFLGFPLPEVATSILKIDRKYQDLVSGQYLDIKASFVEQLTHDSYIILIPELPQKERTELEGVLKIFNQSYRLEEDAKLLEVDENDFVDNQLAKQILHRLQKGATDEAVLRSMEIEEEVENTIDQHIREKEELREALNQRDDAIRAQNRIIEELKQQIEGKKKKG